MSHMLLSIKNLRTWFHARGGISRAVDGVSFDVLMGKTMAVVGESGSGKSVSALSIMRLIQGPAGVIEGGEIFFQGKDILKTSEREMRKIRGNRISMIFQEPMTSLNPVLTVGEQITEVIRLHKGASRRAALEQAVEILNRVKVPDPEKRVFDYPHQLSGGMKQRVMIAIALSCEPDLLIADEPTTALDVTIQAQVLELMKDLQKNKGTAILLITHDMGVVYEMADHVAVMYAGRIVEQAERSRFFHSACHPYTTRLFESLPNRGKRSGRLSVIPGLVPDPAHFSEGCRFADRCHLVMEKCHGKYPDIRSVEREHTMACHLEKPPPIEIDYSSSSLEEKEKELPDNLQTVLSVDDLKVHYPIRRGLLKRVVGHVKAVDGIDFSIREGETLGLVGESGCGKTTAGKGTIRLLDTVTGNVQYLDHDLARVSNRQMRALRKDLQIMFQDPYGSLNPRMMVNRIISEGLISLGIGKNKKERETIVKESMERVGLDYNMAHRYPHEFSGGQRQRIGIARFLALKPKFVVCDEVTSALDVSVQAQVLNLLKTLQREEKLSYLFITHNLSVVSYIADRVAVMYLGRIVELGTIHEVFDSSKHPYTRALMAASPKIGGNGEKKLLLKGEVPSPITPPEGCHFHPRCPEVMPICRESYPSRHSSSKTHFTHCWIYSR